MSQPDAIFTLHARLEGRVRDLRNGRSGHLRLVSKPPLGYSLVPRGATIGSWYGRSDR